jgi:hypothetical protein
MKKLTLFLAVAILLVVGGQLLARHVTHPVTPENIEKQPFAFTVQVKDVVTKDKDKKDKVEFKEFVVTVKQKAGYLAPVSSATGKVTIAGSGKNTAAFSPVTKVESLGVQTYTFRLSPSDLDRAYFTFTETPEDVRVPFPFPGDYWVFDLSKFVGSPKK